MTNELKPKKKRRSKIVIYKGITFDSKTECLYYQHLETDSTVLDVKIQPKYQIIDPYETTCKKCRGQKKTLNPTTKNLNNCSRCKGVGKVQKPGAVYTADFLVEYIDGYTEVVDVKGYTGNQKAFFIRKKLFESINGVELIIVKLNKTQTGWVRS